MLSGGGRVLIIDPEGLITTSQAAELAGVSTGAIRQWVRRGHLEKAGIDERGQSMFRVADVARAEFKTHKHARRETWRLQRSA